MTTNPTSTNAIEAWNTAGRELGIEVVAPFHFSVDGRKHECVAWVAHLGHENGIVLVGTSPPDFAIDRTLVADARHAGYQWSALDLRSYAVFNRARFIDALIDWGYVGPEGRRPPWLDEAAAVESQLQQTAEAEMQRYAEREGLEVQQTNFWKEVTVRPTGERTAYLRLTLREGSQRDFEYRWDASGVGKLCRV
jgi:hypothetical protein